MAGSLLLGRELASLFLDSLLRSRRLVSAENTAGFRGMDAVVDLGGNVSFGQMLCILVYIVENAHCWTNG